MASLIQAHIGSWRWWARNWRLALRLEIGACCVVGMRPVSWVCAVSCTWCGRTLNYREIDDLVAPALAMGLLAPRVWLTMDEVLAQGRAWSFRV